MQVEALQGRAMPVHHIDQVAATREASLHRQRLQARPRGVSQQMLSEMGTFAVFLYAGGGHRPRRLRLRQAEVERFELVYVLKDERDAASVEEPQKVQIIE